MSQPTPHTFPSIPHGIPWQSHIWGTGIPLQSQAPTPQQSHGFPAISTAFPSSPTAVPGSCQSPAVPQQCPAHPTAQLPLMAAIHTSPKHTCAVPQQQGASHHTCATDGAATGSCSRNICATKRGLSLLRALASNTDFSPIKFHEWRAVEGASCECSPYCSTSHLPFLLYIAMIILYTYYIYGFCMDTIQRPTKHTAIDSMDVGRQVYGGVQTRAPSCRGMQ